MASPICLVNSASTLNGVFVGSSTTPTIQLQSTSGVTNWTITVENASYPLTSSDYTVTVTDIYNKIATVTLPTYRGIFGYSLRFRSTVNDGLSNGVYDPSLTTTFVIWSGLSSAYPRPLAPGETIETDPTFGFTKELVRAQKDQVSRGYQTTYLLSSSVDDLSVIGKVINIISNNSANEITGLHPIGTLGNDSINYSIATDPVRYLINVNASDFILKHQSISSTYTFFNNTGADITVTQNKVITLIYNNVMDWWYAQ